MKTIIAGSRDIVNIDLVKEAMSRLPWAVTEVVTGGARGVDLLGEEWALNHQIKIEVFNAEWDLYGKAAGFIRNAQMAKYADSLVAIWDGKARGTSHMIAEAKTLGLEVLVFLVEELEDSTKRNPIKSNPIFGKDAIKRADGEGSSNVETKTIELNGKFLVLFSDSKKNSPLTNMVAEIVSELQNR